MLRSVKGIHGFAIHASNGEIGHADDFLFDDETWTVRYLVVNTGNWLTGRLVLISPASLGSVDWDHRCLNVNLTCEQVERSPDIATDEPLSRRKEEELARYYNYPPYWAGPGLWGSAMFPAYPPTAGVLSAPLAPLQSTPPSPRAKTEETHLRSTQEVRGYHIEASDGEIGHVDDFIIDDANWAIRYMVVDTRNWLPGKRVLVAPQWIKGVSWADWCVEVDLTKEAIRQAPAYDPAQVLNREYEATLYSHYGRPGYWEGTAER